MAKKLFYYNQLKYTNLAYNKPNGEQKTISKSGCGVVSACIAINTAAQKELFTVKEMTELALSSGARNNYGTVEVTLLNAVKKKYPEITYKATGDINELVAHLKNGGTAICNQDDTHEVFSNAGHFVCAWQMVGKNIEVADPSNKVGKYDASPKNKRIVAKTDEGCIVTPDMMKFATQERYGYSYFLITYTPKKKKKYFTPDATINKDCKVWWDNEKKNVVYTLAKGDRVKVRLKGPNLAQIQFTTANGYGTGLVKVKNLKLD